MSAMFYSNQAELEAFHQRLKQTPCPFCRFVGALILYGALAGYDETSDRRIIRGRRVRCNNRKVRNNGCGKTFAIWAGATIKRLRLSTNTLWKFLAAVVQHGNKRKAMNDANPHLSDSTAYRVFKRFTLAQAAIRSILVRVCDPPKMTSDVPEFQVVAHLQHAFAKHSCPISAYQQMAKAFVI